MVSLLMSSRLDGPGTSDVSVTLVTTAELDAGGPVVVTLIGAASYRGRLDSRGCCVIRGVPDGPYRIDISRERDLVSGAAILRLPGTAG